LTIFYRFYADTTKYESNVLEYKCLELIMLIKIIVFTVFMFGEVCSEENPFIDVYDEVSFYSFVNTVGLIKLWNRNTKLK